MPRKIKSLDGKVEWKRAGVVSPAPTSLRRLKLALREADLPPQQDPAKLVIE